MRTGTTNKTVLSGASRMRKGRNGAVRIMNFMPASSTKAAPEPAKEQIPDAATENLPAPAENEKPENSSEPKRKPAKKARKTRSRRKSTVRKSTFEKQISSLTIRQMKHARFVNGMGTFFIAADVLLLIVALIVTLSLVEKIAVLLGVFIFGIFLKIRAHTSLNAYLDYSSLDKETQKNYQDMAESWMSLDATVGFATISFHDVDPKSNGGSDTKRSMRIIRTINELPPFVNSSLQPFGFEIKALEKKIYFFPDALLIVSKNNAKYCYYSDIYFDFDTVRMVEGDSVPDEVRVVGETWLHVNKDGTPDKRFNDNMKVLICEYGRLQISSTKADIYRELTFLNIELLEKVRKAFNQFCDSATSETPIIQETSSD
jgi:hypothetical protein